MIGFGQTGLASGLRTYREFAEQSSAERIVLAELRPGKSVSGWVNTSGNVWVATISESYDGITRDICSVKTLIDTGITRVDSIALCGSTSWSYYYDPDVPVGTRMWDSSKPWWDTAGTYWDEFPQLFLNLGGADPNDTEVQAFFPFYFSSEGVVHPSLGVDLLDGDGGFESAVTTSLQSGFSATYPDTTLDESGSMFKVSASGAADGRGGRAVLSLSTIAGATYRVSGYYSTGRTNPSGLDAVIGVLDTGLSRSLATDGRSTGSGTTYLSLSSTYGETRRFVFDFVAPGSAVELRVGLQNASGGSATGTASFDTVTLKRVYRYNYWEPRLSASHIPQSESGSNDVFFGGKRIGVGGISLSTSDGDIDVLLGGYDWESSEVIISTSGRFLGQTITIDDTRRAFTGLVQDLTWTDDTVQLELQDIRAFFYRDLPPRSYSEMSGMDGAVIGKVRPMLFGLKEGINPPRISTGDSGYGTYEIADTDKAPNGIKSVDAVYAYTDTEAAKLQDTTKRKLLVENTDYTTSLASGQITIIADCGPYEVVEDNRRLNFDVGASELTATLDVGLYTAAGLAAEVQSRMRSATGDTSVTVTYDQSSHLFTISRTGTLNLLCGSGTSKDKAWSLIGFENSDLTGSTSYTGTNATFTDADDHVIRCTAKGYKDDASGTYTGTANAMIEVGSDICRVLLVKFLGKSPDIIDETSFVAARSRAPESLSIYLSDPKSSREIFDSLEYSNIANIVVGGDGTVFYEVYVGEVPANIVDLFDYDYHGFQIRRGVSDVYAAIRVRHDQNPETGEWKSRIAHNDQVSARFGRPDERSFDTYIKTGTAAIAAAERLRQLASSPARVITFSVKGRLIDKRVGQKLRLTRERAMDASGRLSAKVVRIISLKQDHVSHMTTVDCVDDVVTVAGYACVTSCQAACESGCQSSCQISCQATCESACQTGCQSACQGSCESNCQVGCEVNCQTGCEVTCESVCEGGGCQTSCEAGCQTSCQTGCQTSCQTGCQTSCESGCETGCESTCQTTCETGCQNSCESNCQESCEVACQSNCQQECQSVHEYNGG